MPGLLGSSEKASLIPPPRSRSPAYRAPGTALPHPSTHADGDPRALAERFGSSLDAVQGSHETVESTDAVAGRVAAYIAVLRETDATEGLSFARVIAWTPDALGLPDLSDRLARDGISVVVPDNLHDAIQRRDAADIAVGITSVDAALASTGTLVMRASAGQSRAASLLPLHHIVLVPASRIHPTVEAWIASLRKEGRLDETIRDSAQLTFITGPSK